MWSTEYILHAVVNNWVIVGQETLTLDRSTAYIFANGLQTLTEIRCSKPI